MLVSLALLTYGSRVAALAVLPPLPARVAAIVDRMPPALFAGLASQSLLGMSGSPNPAPVFVATMGALLVAPMRSLPACLVGGLAGYALATVMG